MLLSLFLPLYEGQDGSCGLELAFPFSLAVTAAQQVRPWPPPSPVGRPGNRALWPVRTATSLRPHGSRCFFSDIHCEDLLELLEVKLTILCPPPCHPSHQNGGPLASFSGLPHWAFEIPRPGSALPALTGPQVVSTASPPMTPCIC